MKYEHTGKAYRLVLEAEYLLKSANKFNESMMRGEDTRAEMFLKECLSDLAKVQSAIEVFTNKENDK